jgi:predicted phosphohydrolase
MATEEETPETEAPPIETTEAPPGMGMEPQPFDPDLHRAEIRRQAARAAWQQMVQTETQLRVLQEGVAQAVDANGNSGMMMVDKATRQAAKQVAEREAARLRRNAVKMLRASEVDELDLIVTRIAFLADYITRLEGELVVNEDMRDNPDLYGHAFLDQRPLDMHQVRSNIAIIEVALADARAELGYYESTSGS